MTNKYKDDQYKQLTKSHGYKSSDKEELLVLKEGGRLSRDAEVAIDGQVHGLEQVLCPSVCEAADDFRVLQQFRADCLLPYVNNVHIGCTKVGSDTSHLRAIDYIKVTENITGVIQTI